MPAQETSLLQALKSNDGFYLPPVDCQALSQALYLAIKAEESSTGNKKKTGSKKTVAMIKPYAVYLEQVAGLGGCFVL